MAAATIPNTFIDNAKVMAKGQVTIPKDVRQVLGISSGSRVTFLVENGSVRLINSAVYAMEMMQHEMKNEGTDLQTEEDVNKLVKATRDEEN
jgi:antitoxin PrlF